jgi:hypothetical protein
MSLATVSLPSVTWEIDAVAWPVAVGDPRKSGETVGYQTADYRSQQARVAPSDVPDIDRPRR